LTDERKGVSKKKRRRDSNQNPLKEKWNTTYQGQFRKQKRDEKGKSRGGKKTHKKTKKKKGKTLLDSGGETLTADD